MPVLSSQRVRAAADLQERVSVVLMDGVDDGFVWVGVSTTEGVNFGNAASTGQCVGLSRVFAGMNDTTLTKAVHTHARPLRYTRLVALHLA